MGRAPTSKFSSHIFVCCSDTQGNLHTGNRHDVPIYNVLHEIKLQITKELSHKLHMHRSILCT